MSKVTTVLNNGQQAITNFDLSKIFVYNNRYESASIVNSKYDPETLLVGTVMGRIAGTNTVTPWTSLATDGSQFPIGILASDITIAIGATSTVPICVAGDVAQEQIVIWNGSDSLTSVVSGRTLYDRIQSDSVGIKIVSTSENTYTDNQ